MSMKMTYMNIRNHSLVDDRRQVVLGQQFLEVFEVEHLAHPLGHLVRQEGDVDVVGSVVLDHRLHLVYLLHHRWREQVYQSAYDHRGLYQREERGYDAVLHAEYLHVELAQRFEKVGYQTCQTEGQEHVGEPVEQPDHHGYEAYGEEYPDGAVECERT